MELQEQPLTLILRFIIAIIVSLASLVLVGWILNIPILTSFVSEPVRMNPLTAILFLLSGLGLQGYATNAAKSTSGLPSKLTGGTLVACGFAVIIAYVFNWSNGVDRILFANTLDGNRMAPNTAAYFLFVGLSLLTLNAGRCLKSISQSFTLLVLIGALTSLLGYGYGAQSLYGIGNYIPMALNTSMLFLIVAVGVLCAVRQDSMLLIFCGDKSGSSMIRRLLPIAIVVPCLFGFLRILGQRAGWYETEFGAAIMAATTVVLLVTAVILTASELNRGDEKRAVGEAALRSANSKLRSQTQILEAILNSMGDGVVVADETGQFVLFNPAAQQILGVGPINNGTSSWTTEYGCFLSDKVTPYPFEQLPLVRALRGETVTEEELYIRNRNRAEGLWINISGEPLSDSSGNCKGGLVVFRDVSERRKAEEALRNSHDQLEKHVAERTKELARTNNELSQKNQENEMFVYSVSHDLRSPLVNLQGFSKELNVGAKELKILLMDDQVPIEIREKAIGLLETDVQQALRFIQLSVLRLGNIIEALLRLSRIGSVEYQCQTIDLQSMLAHLIESMSVVLLDAGVSISVYDLPSCYGDSTAVEQLFANLINNAVKYRDPGRSCIIEIGSVDSNRGRCRTYYVKDNGLGIPAAHQEKIFQAFKRVHPKVAEGEGIGLTIVRRTVERHGGCVSVESQEGHGSTFFVTLPIQTSSHTTKNFDLGDTQYKTEGHTEDEYRANGNSVSRRR